MGEGEERSSSSHHHANSRCDKVTACKHQSNLNLAYHLPSAVCSSFPSPFGVLKHPRRTESYTLLDPSVVIMSLRND